MELGHLLTRSGLTYLEVSSKVCHDSFCQLGNSVSLPWVIYYEAFYLHVVSIFSCIPVICLKLVLFLIPLQFVNLPNRTFFFTAPQTQSDLLSCRIGGSTVCIDDAFRCFNSRTYVLGTTGRWDDKFACITIAWKPCQLYEIFLGVMTLTIITHEHHTHNYMGTHRGYNNKTNANCGLKRKTSQHSGRPILTLRRLMSYIYGAPILDVSRSHTTTQHSR